LVIATFIPIIKKEIYMRILVFQHLAVEHPGILLEFWKEAGHQWTAVELDEGGIIPPLDEFDLMVVMGGPMDVWQQEKYPWLIREKLAIRKWVVELGKPYLGICLGHQLLAVALGGHVDLMQRPEVGLADVHLTPEGLRDPLLAGFPSRVATFQWHGAEVSLLPQGAIVLAANAACPVQAFRWGSQAYGFQYHVEITPTTVSDWENIPEYFASLQAALGAERAAGLASAVRPQLPAFRKAAQRLNANLHELLKQPSVFS
jgi:GMP synthase-like glutamine amidotransferase